MIVIRYTGGLGNQMFIYAMQIVLEQKFPDEEIFADLTRYSYSKEHDGFDIMKYFQVHITEMDTDTRKKTCFFNYIYTGLRINKLLRRWSVCGFERLDNFFEKRNKKVGIISVNPYIYDKDIFNINRDKNIWHYKGNWINPLYWDGLGELIRDSLIFREELLSKEDRLILYDMEKNVSVAMHIRKGDYKGDYGFDLCTDQYYIDALNYLTEVLGSSEKIKLYVFSEEPDLNLDFLRNINYQFICHSDGGVDLYMMSKCRHNIIANSTFSYWSAVLNRNKEKIIVAPLYVYRENSFFRRMPVFSDWVQINNI